MGRSRTATLRTKLASSRHLVAASALATSTGRNGLCRRRRHRLEYGAEASRSLSEGPASRARIPRIFYLLCSMEIPHVLVGAVCAAPNEREDKSNFRPLLQRRSCGRWSWQLQRFPPGQVHQPPWQGPWSLLGKLRGCKPPRSQLYPTN
jgi:hypothetical protein